MAQDWLKAMSYEVSQIDQVNAEKIKGSFKADVQVKINVEIKLKNLTDIQNIQVKLVSNNQGFNQIDKRRLSSYKELWDIPQDVMNILSHYCGEKPPFVSETRDSRRMFMNEFSIDQQSILLDFLNKNKTLIVSDILKGRGQFAAEWMLVILNLENKDLKWVLKPINFVLNYFGNGDILITKQGNLKIGRIGMQRKGGDAGRSTANMLQFKIDPTRLFEVIS